MYQNIFKLHLKKKFFVRCVFEVGNLAVKKRRLLWPILAILSMTWLYRRIALILNNTPWIYLK